MRDIIKDDLSLTKRIERISLLSMSPGTERFLKVHRYGIEGARPKVYIQASLHADEIPGMLVTLHLLDLLDAADRKGHIEGEIIVVPVANPIGLGQIVNGSQSGRYDLRGGGNFNRQWPDLFEGLLDAVQAKLGPDKAANVSVIRAAIGEKLSRMTADTELEMLKIELARLAHDADMVLDLHCDDESLVYICMQPMHWKEFNDLAAELGARACLLCIDSRANSFDEAFSLPWNKLQDAIGDKFPIPNPCFGTTVEFRGQGDVSDELASKDAVSLFRFLQRHGAISGDPGPAPALQCDGTDLEAADMVRSPTAGIIAYRVPIGADVKKGDVVFDVVDPLADDPNKDRVPVHAAGDGLVVSLCVSKLAVPGYAMAMIVGKTKLAHRATGILLGD